MGDMICSDGYYMEVVVDGVVGANDFDKSFKCEKIYILYLRRDAASNQLA